MTVRYFDSVGGNDANSGLTPAAAWASYDVKAGSCVSGDTLLFKRGTTQIINTIYRSFPNGTVSNPTYVGAYGEGNKPIFMNPTSVGNMIFNSSNASYVIYEDLDFDCTHTSGTGNSQPLYISAQGAGASNNLIFRRCVFRNSKSSGMVITQETAATAAPNNILLEDCLSHSNGGHGFFTTGYNVTFNRCVAYNNGLTTGAHGFTSYRLREDQNTGWALVSGQVYSKAVSRTDYYYARVLSGAQSAVWPQLVKNTTTPTSPSPGEFGFSAGTVYINIGADPTGHTFNFAYGLGGYGIVYNYCYAFDNKAYVDYPWHEGHGFAFDDYSSFSSINNCYSTGNEGAGLSINQGEQITVRNCVFANNDYYGISINGLPNHYIYNNLLYNNGATLPVKYAEIFVSGRASGVDIRNNIIYPTYCVAGIDFQPIARTNQTVSNNIIYSPNAEMNKWVGNTGSGYQLNNLFPYSLFEGTNGASAKPTGWAQLGGQAAVTTLIGPETVNGITTKVVQMRKIGGSGSVEGLHVPMVLSNNKTYVVSLYVRIPTGVTASDIIIYFATLAPNSATILSAANMALLPKDIWVRVLSTFSVTTGSQTHVGIACQTASAGSGFDFALPQLFEGTAFSFVTGYGSTNTYVVDPKLSDNGPSLTNLSPVKGKGARITNNLTDMNGKSFFIPGSVGPWELGSR